MVDVNFARNRKSQAIVVAVPRARSRRASAAGHDVATIALQNGLSGIAGAADCYPVVEQIAVVSRAIILGFDGQLGQIGSRSGDRDRCGKVATAGDGWFDWCSECSAGSKKHCNYSVESHGSE